MKKERKPHSFCETPEEKCTMNYCDDNGCQNRISHLVNPIPEIHSVMAEKQNYKVLELLKRNYPELDTNDMVAVQRLVETENLSIHFGEVDIQMNGETVRAQQVVKIFKELI